MDLRNVVVDVKFLESKKITQISAQDILEFKKAKPISLTDFQNNILYTCIYKDDKDLIPKEYAVQIGRMSEKGTGKNSSTRRKRIIFPPLNDSDITEYYESEMFIDEKSKEDKKKVIEIEKKKTTNNKKDQLHILNEKKKMKCPQGFTLSLKPVVTTTKVEVHNINNKKDEPIQNVEDVEKITLQNENAELTKKNFVLMENNTKLRQKLEDLENSINENGYNKLKEENNNLKNQLKECENKISSLQSEVHEYKIYNKKLQMIAFSQRSSEEEGHKHISASKNEEDKYSPPASPRGNNTNEINEIHTSTPQTLHELEKSIEKIAELDNSLPSTISENVTPKSVNLKKRLAKRVFSKEEEEDVKAEEVETVFKTKKRKTNRISSDESMEQEPNKKVEEKSKISIPNIEKDDRDATSLDKKEKEVSFVRLNKNKLVEETTDNKFKFKEKIFNNDTQVNDIYLRHGYTIPEDDWKIIMKKKNASKFSKAMIRMLFGSKEELVKYCIKPGKNVLTTDGTPRQPIPPKILDVLEMSLEYYLKKNNKGIGNEALKMEVNKITHYISEEMNTSRKDLMTKKDY